MPAQRRVVRVAGATPSGAGTAGSDERPGRTQLEAGESVRQAAAAEGVPKSTVHDARDRLRRGVTFAGAGVRRTANTDDPLRGGFEMGERRKSLRSPHDGGKDGDRDPVPHVFVTFSVR